MTRWLPLSLALALILSGLAPGRVAAEEETAKAEEGASETAPDVRAQWVELLAKWQRVRTLGTQAPMTLEGMVELERSVKGMLVLTVRIKEALPFDWRARIEIERAIGLLQRRLVRLLGGAQGQVPGLVYPLVNPVRGQLWTLQETFPEGFLPPPHLPKAGTPGWKDS